MRSDVRAFYDDLADDYDVIFADWDVSVRRQAALIAPLLGSAESILDVAAGMGTQAIGLALAGRRVVGRDLSAGLIERGRREAARLGAELHLEVGDMREVRDTDAGAFGAVIAFDNALPHLEDDASLLAALRAARLALAPGGVFAASIRDYDALVASRPCLDEPRLIGASPSRRLILQAWAWSQDGTRYDLDHLVLREDAGGWSCRTWRTRYRALLRSELAAVALAAGMVGGEWLMPATTGFYQPIFRAFAPAA